MNYYLAPMEGITGYVYRNALEQVFPSVDQYFTPFITPNQNRGLRSRELRDILPEHNQNIKVIPQILTNQAEGFLTVAKKCQELGYEEVNLNLGCPSQTVVPKKRGSGFLAYPEELEIFLETVCQALEQEGMRLSVKTRIGKYDPEEFDTLLAIYNKFPLTELIVHPRIQTDYYKNTPRMEAFSKALWGSDHKICFNGDLFDRKSYEELVRNYSGISSVMFGRGMIANPNLIQEIKTGQTLKKEDLQRFHEAVYLGYQESIAEIRNVLFKMKEFWSYTGFTFEDEKKHVKRIKKSMTKEEYDAAVVSIFAEKELKENPRFFG